MKKILILSILLISILSFGQNFPGERTELLLNKKVKQKRSYLKFRKKFNKKTGKLKGNFLSDYKKLVGKTFTITNVYSVPELYKGSRISTNYVLELSNKEVGVIYYDYNAYDESEFDFEVIGGLNPPADFYCEKIEIKKDKFTGETKLYTPLVKGSISYVPCYFYFIKVIRGDKATIYMNIEQYARTVSVNKKGVYLLFDDGSKLSKDSEALDVKVDDSGNYYKYRAFFPLSESDISILTKKLITDDRLYIYDGTVSKDKAKEIQEYLKCLINK